MKAGDTKLKGNKFLRYFLIAVLLLFLIHQVYSSVYNPITTEAAQFYEAIDGITVRGLIIREESLISGPSGGVLHFVTQDGSRVSKDGIVAEVYDSTSSSYTVDRIGEITEEITDIQNIMAYNNVSAADQSVANARVNEAIGALVTGCRGGNYSQSGSLSSSLVSAINRRQAVTGEQTDFSARLGELSAELSSLSATLPAASGYVRAPMSGYFLSHTDGYESPLSGKTPEEITPELIDGVKKEEVPQDVIGKIVSGYEWLVAAKISVNDAAKYSVGDELVLHTALGGGEDLPVTVRALNSSAGSSDAVIVLSCGSVSRELASMRYGNFTIVNKTYSGLKIAEKALRRVDDKTGVYIISGVTVKFVPVEVIYTVDDYIICKQENSNENVLRLYDDVIVKGKKLYDGKVVA